MENMSQSDAADSESTEEGLRSWNIQVKPMQWENNILDRKQGGKHSGSQKMVMNVSMSILKL